MAALKGDKLTKEMLTELAKWATTAGDPDEAFDGCMPGQTIPDASEIEKIFK